MYIYNFNNSKYSSRFYYNNFRLLIKVEFEVSLRN